MNIGMQLIMMGCMSQMAYGGWDISTAVYDNKSFSVEDKDIRPYSVSFKSDGTMMYILGNTNYTIYQYTLSTAWDVSTASYDSKSFSVASQSTQPFGLFFKTDGSKMYFIDEENDVIYQYTLSTAWDVSTASYDSKSFSVASQSTQTTNLSFKPDGTKMYVIDNTVDSVYQYTLSTAWDVSTASYDSKSFSVASQELTPYGLFFKTDGSKMYITGFNNATIFQYSLG